MKPRNTFALKLVAILASTFALQALPNSWFRQQPSGATVTKVEKKTINRLLRGTKPTSNEAPRYSKPYQPPPKSAGVTLIPESVYLPKETTPPFQPPVVETPPAPPVAQATPSYAADTYVPPPAVPTLPVTPVPAPPAAQPSAREMVPWHQLLQDNDPLGSKKERKKRKPVLKKKTRKDRRLASLSPVNMEKAKVPEMPGPVAEEKNFLLAFSGSYNMVTSGSLWHVTQGANALNSSNHFTLGLNGRFQAKYVNVEIDSYLGLASRTAPGEGTSVHNGAYADLKAQLPFRMGGMKFKPYAGIGYGYAGVSQSGTTSGGVERTGAMDAQGPYWVAGIEMTPFNRLSIRWDYAQAFSTNASRSLTGAPAISGPGFFDRARIGLFFDVTASNQIGAQYTMRAVGLKTVGLSEFSDQLSAVFMFHF